MLNTVLPVLSISFVVLPGLEPGISGPESDVLPLHHRTIRLFAVNSLSLTGANLQLFLIAPNFYAHFFNL